ncbi:response regulator [Thiorhodospira sibirica]|uniref:response regulator n=1 Tax=Thiorhodospira sibirica TaxID=154347 RepID=UPI00022C0B80|nr:response regulator [Thiorhodospira sibirica]
MHQSFRLGGLALVILSWLLALPLLADEVRLAENGVLRVVGDENYPPYLFLNAVGEPDGYLADLWQLWSRVTGVAVELEAPRWEEAQRRLLDGEADVIENIFKTPQRERLYTFSAAYATLPVAIYRDTAIGGLTRVESLQGFQIGIMRGDACIEWLERNGIHSLTRYDNYRAVIEAADAGEIKVFCMDEYPANYYLYQQNAHRRFVKAFDLYQGEFHRAVRIGQQALLDQVEQGMAAIPEADLAALQRKWLETPLDFSTLTTYALEVVSALGLLLILGGLWILSLRRAVAMRTTALHERETQLRSLGDNLPHGFIYQFEVVNDQPRFRYVSAGAERILGLRAAQLYQDASPLLAHLSTDILADYLAAQAHSAAMLTDFSARLPLTRADGEQRWMLVRSRPRRTPDRTTLWDSIALDITEQQQAEVELTRYRQELESLVTKRTAALKEAHDRLACNQLAMDRVGMGIAWNSAETGQFLYANDETCRQLGYRREEILKLTTSDINLEFSPDDLKGIAATLRTSRERLKIQTQHRRKDGSIYRAEVTVYLHLAGEEEWFIAFFEDISARKAAEAELLHARDAAEEATRAKSDFLANMSHEIRTPMNAILGMSHLALQTDLSPKQRNYIEKAHRSAESLLGLLNDILDFSKIEAGKLDIEQSPFRLEDVFDNLANLVGLKAGEKGLELLFDLSPELPTALIGDALRLGQVLTNLGNNAVKFTDPGGEILIRAVVAEDSPTAVRLHFSVRDTGIGLSSGQQQRLFQSFTQADSSTTRKYGGTGLGLAICKRLTALMDGKIWVESALGVGSTFHFTVRLGKQRGHASQRRPRSGVLPALRVLVVDDSPSAREVLSSMLTAFGFQVAQAASGAEAIDRLETAAQEQAFDLVLMDWKMPGMDGLDTARAIARDHLITQAPTVIMVTAYGRDEALRAADDLDLAGFLTKPVTPSTLLDAMLLAMVHALVPDTRAADLQGETAEALAKLCGAHILLVEDNPINQELALELLTTNGMSASVANNGREALELLQAQRFDGVLMDCQMPVMDGYQAARAIRADPRWRDLPVLAMTANVMAGDREKALAAGMNDHIGKPVKVREMLTAMARWIEVDEKAATHEHPSTRIQERDKALLSMGVDSCLPALPGIDTQTGLSIAQGHQALYLRLLRRFRDSQARFADDFAAALARLDQDPEAATRCAHTLKGVAANIGAEQVRAAAAELEAACQSGQPSDRIESLLKATLAVLEPVLDGLAQLKQPAEVPRVAPAIDLSALKPEMTRLRALLADDDTEATEVIASLSAQLANTRAADCLRPVARAVENYDFEAALVALDQMETYLR